MAETKILVPFNFTDYDEKVLHHVIRNFADQKWVKITLFHVYTPLPEINGYNPALGRLKSTIASFSKEIREKEAELKKIREDLLDNGFTKDQMGYVFKSRVKGIGGEIVDMARRGSYDTVILSHKPGKITRAFTRKVHDKILSDLKDTTVSIIT